jgi:hypothetical protein
MNVARCEGKCYFVDGGHVLFCQHCGFQVAKLAPGPGYLDATAAAAAAVNGGSMRCVLASY